ncbi:MAG: glycosyltransferase family 2 protein [Nitrososphaerota archaeon]|jgi:cellulose synthase/poly-beta-1,6-N-acetylglucosamine synthase-like glycosyltransferase|nr:glycosyltransferase family 2 protein [Nitrososphaerota archaeon]
MLVIFETVSIVLLSVLLFWSVYNGSIIYVGIRNKRKIQPIDISKNTPQDLPTFSIIVPTKNEETVIYRCLNGIMNIDYPKEKLQIIVIDGNSADNTSNICNEIKQQYPENITVIREQTTHGKPTALNIALTYATGDIVGVFDADSLPEKNVLLKVASYFTDKQITAIQGMTTSINAKNNLLTRVISSEEKAWFQMLMSGREKMHLFVPLNGSCQFIRHNILTEMGGWNENSLTEDVELALRLVEKNHFVKYAPDVCSGQETPNALKSLFKQRVRWYRGYMETALKYGRLLEHINKRTIDAEISLAGPFMMVVSLLSYINWFLVAFFFSQSTPVLNFTGLVIALTAVSLVSVGVGLVTSEKPIKPKNIFWIPCVYVYWLVQMFIAGWAFLKLIFRSKRDWTKTTKTGIIAPKDTPKKDSSNHR